MKFNDQPGWLVRAEKFLARVLLLPLAIPVYIIGSYYLRKEHNDINRGMR